MDFELILQDFIKKKKYSEIIFFIQTKIPEIQKNSFILNLLGTARLSKSKEYEGNNKTEEIFLSVEDFRSAHLKEKNTPDSLKGLQNFIHVTVLLFDRLMRQSPNNPKVINLMKDARNYIEKNKNFFVNDIPTLLSIIKLYKRFTCPEKVKFYYDQLIEKKFFNIKSINSYIYQNMYFNDWKQKNFFQNTKILDDNLPKYSEADLISLTNNKIRNRKKK